ncbi:MAG: hypothetical protein HQL24_09935 [Candidatus Omnitrophica bacterium]|nr:hypothetical protein [Candidatus Omnitrophota bacterium]
MNREEAREWLRRYNDEEDLYNTGLEEELRKVFRENRFMTKPEFLKIIKWKFMTMPGREQREKNLIELIPDESIKAISFAAFKIEDDKLRMKLLGCIPGAGLAVASTILTFYDPEKYGIYDIHSWRGVMETKEPENATLNDFEKFLIALRRKAGSLKMSCRDFEKACFKRDKVIPLIKKKILRKIV